MIKRAVLLSIADIKNILRDSVMLVALLGPIVLTLLIKVGFPFMSTWLIDNYSFSLAEHYLFICSFALLMTPLMLGMIVGFLILDDRDEKLLMYFAITPLTKQGYLGYRLFSQMLLSFGVLLLQTIIFGLFEASLLFMIKMLLALLAIAMTAPLMALVLTALASNKVEGMAVSKLLGIVILAPIISYIVSSWWTWLLGIFPPFWSVNALLYYNEGSIYWLYLITGILIHLLFIQLFLRRYELKLADFN